MAMPDKPKTFEDHFKRWLMAKHDTMFNRLKSTESPIEAIAYLHLIEWADYTHRRYNQAISVRTQVEVKKYRVDFLVESNGRKIVVECDGHEFHEKTKSQATRDKKRDRDLIRLGYQVLRYTGTEVCNNPEQILIDLQQLLLPPNRGVSNGQSSHDQQIYKRVGAGE